jgi:predicted N-acetyltransferase YhbS
MLLRPMTYDDVPAVERVTAAAFYQLDVATRPPGFPEPEMRPPERAGPWMDRLRHVLAHDPGGSWVAEEDGSGAIVGIAASTVREGLWGLSSLAVLPGVQAKGIGKQLLEAVLRQTSPGAPAIICSSHDPRAVRRYRLAGFDLHPALFLWGRPDRSAIPALPDVRDGDASDIALLDEVDRVARGHGHGPDHEIMTAQLQLKVVERGKSRGYAYVSPPGGNYLLAATDERSARQALWSALAESQPEGEIPDVHNITAHQTWAIDLGLQAGMELHQHGYVALRHLAPPWPYIPSGHFL